MIAVFVLEDKHGRLRGSTEGARRSRWCKGEYRESRGEHRGSTREHQVGAVVVANPLGWTLLEDNYALLLFTFLPASLGVSLRYQTGFSFNPH